MCHRHSGSRSEQVNKKSKQKKIGANWKKKKKKEKREKKEANQLIILKKQNKAKQSKFMCHSDTLKRRRR